jgi:hypothetical protein
MLLILNKAWIEIAVCVPEKKTDIVSLLINARVAFRQRYSFTVFNAP